MRKTLLLAAVVGMLLGSAAVAQDSVLFFDIRNNVAADQLIESPVYPYTNGAANFGKAGDAQTLYITPDLVSNFETLFPDSWPNNDGPVGAGNSSTGSLWLYMDVNNAGGGGAGVISSIGLDMSIAAPAQIPGVGQNPLASIAFAWDPAVFTNGGGVIPPFAGKSNGAAVGVTAWNDAKAVEVPVTAVPAFNPTPAGGLYPVNRYRVGELKVVGGARNCTFGDGHVANSTYSLRLSVDGLLITRVFNGVPPDLQEDVAFGYLGGVPEAPYVNGSTAGAPTPPVPPLLGPPWPDATIIVQMKGDTSGDGAVAGNDTSGFITAKAAGTGLTQLQAFLFDASGDRQVAGNDTSGFISAKSAGCP